MPTSTSRLAYSDCYKAYDQALGAKRGIRIRMTDRGTAMYFRMRMHTARKIARKDNLDTYPEDHPMHGRSIYDQLIARVKFVEDSFYLYVERTEEIPGEVEEIADDDVAQVVQREAPKLTVDATPKQLEYIPRRF